MAGIGSGGAREWLERMAQGGAAENGAAPKAPAESGGVKAWLEKMAGTQTTPYQRQTPAAPRDWKTTALETTTPAGMLNFADKMELRTVAEGSGAKIEALKKAEAEALGRKQAAETAYNRPSGGLVEYLTGEQGRRMDDYTKAAGAYDTAKAKREEAERAAAEAKETLARMRYEKLRDNADFGEKSKYVPKPTERKMNYWETFWTQLVDEQAPAVWESSGWEDPFYAWVNGDEAAGAYIKNQDNTYGAEGGAFGHFLDSAVGGNPETDKMEKDEVALFNYIYATEGPEAARSYYDYLRSELYRRNREAEMEQAAKDAEKDPVGASVGSVMLSPLKMATYGIQLGEYLGGGKIEQNAPYNRFSYNQSAIRGQVGADIEKALEEKVGSFWGKAGSFAYNTGMSMADFLLNSAIGGFGAGGNASQVMTLAIMGTGAAADATIEAKDRGLSDGQAFALGTIAGAAEIITENISLEALLKPDWEKGALMYVLKNTLAEGSEEVGSDIINAVADVLISKDKSQWRQSVQSYMDAGYSEGEALGLAARDAALEMGLDFLGGAISGGVMSGVAAGGKAASAWNTGRQMNQMDFSGVATDALIQESRGHGPEYQAPALAEQVQAKLDAGKKLGNYELGNLYQANERAIAAEEQAAAQAQEKAWKEQQRQAKEQAKLKEQLFGPQAQETAASTGETAGTGLVPISEEMQRSLATGKNNFIAKAAGDVVEFARRALQKKGGPERLYMGTLPDTAVQFVQSETGVDLSGFQAILPGYAVQHTYKHHGAAALEEARGQRVVTPQDYGMIPDILAAPDSVKLSEETDSSGRRVLLFSKQVGDVYVTAQAVTDKRQALTTDTMWIKKGKPTDTTHNVSASTDPVLNARSDPPSGFPISSIPSPAKEVKGGLAYDGLYADRVTRAMAAGGKGTVRPGDYMTLDRVCRELGVQARFADGGAVLGGAGNAHISGREIVVARDHQGALRAVLGHELTHYIQNTAPEAYNAFREIVAADTATAEWVAHAKELYATNGIELDDAGALDEVTADYAGALIENTQVLEEFIRRHRENRSLLEKLLDAIRGIIAKLTGAEKRQAQTAEGRLAAALDAAAANVAQGQQTTAQESSGGRYSIRQTEDGHRYVQADRQVIFGNDPESWRTQLEDYINGKIRRGENVDLIADDGEVLTLTADTAGKVSSPYTSHGTTLPEETYYTKVNAGAHIDELAQVSKGKRAIRADEDGRHGDFAAGGWQYRTAYFRDFDGKYYRLGISVAIGGGGNVVYNIGDIQERSFPSTTELTANGSSAKGGALGAEETSSVNSVPQDGGQVKTKFSLKDQTQSRQFKQWFGDWQNDPEHASKVVDTEGKPLVVYHGTLAKGITAFNKDFIGSRYSSDEVGFFFIDRRSIAEDYARSEFNSDRYGEVIPAYLSIKNPLVVDAQYVRKNGYGDIFKSNDAIDAWDTYQGAFLEAAQEMGADGILVKDGTSTMAVAFEPTQIKSATDNVGTFDGKDPDIRHSLKDPTGFNEDVGRLQEQAKREKWSDERLKEELRGARERAGEKLKSYDPLVSAVTRRAGETAKPPLPPGVAQTAQRPKPGQLSTNPDSLMARLAREGRVDIHQLTEQELARMDHHYDLAIDGEGKLYQVNREEHIDRRTMQSAGNPSVRAFGFDHPELRPYLLEAARGLAEDLDLTVKGERWSTEVFNEASGAMETKWTGVKRQTTEEIAYLLDECRMNYDSIGKALDAILAGGGQENYTAAKRVELVLDGMLTDGYKAIDGRTVEPNQEYIDRKREIPGGRESEAMTETEWEDLMAEPPRTEREQEIEDALRDFMSEVIGEDEGAENAGRDRIRAKLPPLPGDTLKETVTKEWRTIRRRFTDAGDSVAKLGKEIGDKELYAYYNFAAAAANAADNALRPGGEQTDVLGRKVGKSLADIWEPIRQKGEDYYSDFQLYLFHKHNVDRMTRDNRVAIDMAEKAMQEFQDFSEEYGQYAKMPESDLAAEAARGNEEARAYLELLNEYNRAKAVYNKPVFGDEVTARDSADAAAALERAHPEFRELAEEVYEYSRNLMQYRVDSGLLTEEQAAHIESTYPHYVPTYRVQEKEQNGGKRAKGKQVSSTVGVATGGSAALKPLHLAMAEQTERTIKEAARNRLGLRLMEDAGKKESREKARKYIYKIEDAMDGVNEDTFDLMDGAAPKMENTFTVRKGGRAYTMTLSRDMYEGIEALFPERKERGKVYKAARAANSLFKGLTTGYNPVFAAKNFIRDLQEAGLYSRDFRAWAKNYPEAVKEIAKNGEWWRRYQALGGVYSSIFDYREGYKAGEKKNALQKLGDRIEALNMAVEQAPRLAEFMAVAKAGDVESMDTLMDAMYAAADVTTNFGRSGTWGKTVNQTFVPFFNPAMQGLDKMGRLFLSGKAGKKWLALLIRCTLLGFAPALLNELLCKDAPGWEDMRQSDKDVNWLIHIGDGKYIKLPKGRDISVVNMAAGRVVDALTGKEVDLGETLRTAGNQLAPPNPLSNNILAAVMDTAPFDPDDPGRTWYGGDIESQRLRKYAPGQRYDGDTDVISKAIGGALNFSPKKLNYLLDQYTGVVGDFALPLLTPSGEKSLLAPFKKAFLVDTVKSNKVSGEFYDTGDRIDYAKNGGDGPMALVSRYWSKQESMVSDVYKRIRELELSDLPDKEKQEKIRLAKGMLTEVQKKAMEGLEAVEAAARKHYAGDEREALDRAYREMNREVFGAEYALEVYNGDVYEKAAEAKKSSGVSYDAFYDAYFAQKGIVGDKDLYGKTVALSASKKKKAAIDKATPGLSEKQRRALYEALGVSEKVW